jgi:uncharacterized RDD family membrane protein YckC
MTAVAAAEIAGPLEYADYGQRVRAAITDSLIVGLASFALILGLTAFASRGGPFAGTLTSLAYFIDFAGATIYYTVCNAEGGQTVGKLTTNTAVRVDGDEDRSLGYVRAFIRAVFPPFMWLLIIPGLLDVLWPLWDGKHQALHDKLVGSVVVRI